MSLRLDTVSVLAIVPARAGSVGIHRKNLARIGGLSLIARAAHVINKLDWITRAVISTDDSEMLEEGRHHGLETPFIRPAELSHGTAAAHDVLFHAWVESERHYGVRFDYALLLEPTSPLRRSEDVKRTLVSLISSKFDTAATVSPMPAHFAPEKCRVVSSDGALRFFLPEGRKIVARQEVGHYYFLNGIAYALRREPFFSTKAIFSDKTLAVAVDRPVVNIDEPFELELAEWMLARESGH